MMRNANSVTIEVVQEKHFDDVIRLNTTFLNSKHCCCILPLGIGTDEEIRQSYQKCPKKMETSAVALDASGKTVGYIQVIFKGMPCALHKCKDGEAYIYTITVDADARGMGVGSRLLAWAEELAKRRDCTFMSLDVIRGNRAIHLYERKGFVVKPISFVSMLCQAPLVCCLFGPVICPSGSSSYCSYGKAHFMEKQLE